MTPVLRLVGGVALSVVGLALMARFAVMTAPGAVDAAALSATATVTSRSAEPSGWNSGRNQNSELIYREGFSFTDRGTERTGEDQVSATFYAAHPEGDRIEVHYFAEAPDNAVIGPASRLIPPYEQFVPVVGAGALLIGLWFGWVGIRRMRGSFDPLP